MVQYISLYFSEVQNKLKQHLFIKKKEIIKEIIVLITLFTLLNKTFIVGDFSTQNYKVINIYIAINFTAMLMQQPGSAQQDDNTSLKSYNVLLNNHTYCSLIITFLKFFGFLVFKIVFHTQIYRKKLMLVLEFT